MPETDHFSVAQRLDEVADSLASGLIRLIMRQSSFLSTAFPQNLLDVLARLGGHRR